MRSFRILHTADVHLGSPMAGWTQQLPEAWRQRIRKAADGVWQRIVDLALAEQVDVVTIAGDLFDRSDAPMAVHFEWLRGFERLAAANIPVVLCHGNHDPLVSPPPVPWPDLVHVLPAAPVLPDASYVAPSVYLSLAPDTRIQVSGFSYPARALTPSLAYAFVRDPDADFAVALYHGAVGSAHGHAAYCATSEAELAQRGFDVWALGHIHQPQVLRGQRPLIVYPGNPQGRGLQETGPRGCILLDVSAQGAVQTRFCPTADLVWMECEVRIEEDSLASLRRSVLEQLGALCKRCPGHWLLVRVRLVGEGRVAAALADPAEVLEALRQEVAARAWPLWVVALESQVAPPLDLETLAHSPELLGELVRVYRRYREQPEAARDLLRQELADVFHHGNELSVDSLSDAEVAELLAAAFRLLATWAVQEGAG
ncbi:metallophosphoesterase family protein [Alicyclobacillus shizuokensis]|uniref:metallophosphoesterase family protein n=1 Tax=Alicyclobacillus shizuokensis TaxID=392014 RepID=UPI0008370E16|nr:DNA repair exonuclease [Alicyclobacillus shizuokensis]MCL6625660.1 DNA repair exonuclease [Alicyclobacillus shizuokensis]